MRKFMINVNGTSYEVEVEEIGGATASAPVAAAPAGGTKVNAPMPGTIADVKVAVGDTVTKGQVLVLLEAMKMENEIMAPADGKVTAVLANKGASVNTGDALVVLG